MQLEIYPVTDVEDLYLTNSFEINKGVTVLIGPNGAGKSTFLKSLKELYLDKNNITYFRFDNLLDGGANAKSKFGYYGKTDLLIESTFNSEGMNIVLNIGLKISEIGSYIRNIKNKNEEIWILLDAIDSGLSIDNIVQINNVFELIIKDHPNTYIIVSANSYELVRNRHCLDVKSGNYIQFNDYEDYRNFILKEIS